MHIGLHISTRISREPMLRTRSGVMPRGAGRAGRAAQLDLQTRRELRPGQTTRRRPSRGHEGALGCPAKTPTEAPGKSTWSDLLKPRRRARRRIWTASDYNGPPPGSSLPRSRPAPATGDEGGNVLGGRATCRRRPRGPRSPTTTEPSRAPTRAHHPEEEEREEEEEEKEEQEEEHQVLPLSRRKARCRCRRGVPRPAEAPIAAGGCRRPRARHHAARRARPGWRGAAEGPSWTTETSSTGAPRPELRGRDL
ncbi:unnamed protein product [Prorocentrum cordatum]|uniref:Uncharacterized protein n=1 Tax=Prorocentrum cordatum TaxID=2364126 RepID=A0ABN9VZC6_9DINO|nr:unnamed protein product [Polarella glacialis]